MTLPIQPAEGASLFVLGEEGVFFWAPRQELYVFNTSATFIWCCITEGMLPADMTHAYRGAFKVSFDEARAHVAGMLSRWWGLGYIEGAAVPDGVGVSFTTILGRLLSNPRLRQQLADAPRETARRLGVKELDLDAILSLDVMKLERQVTRLTMKATSARQGASVAPDAALSHLVGHDKTLLEFATEVRGQSSAPATIERYYRMLTTTFCLRFSSASQEMCIHPSFAHLAVAGPQRGDTIIDILEGDDGHVIFHDQVPVKHCRHLDQLAPKIKSLFRHIAINRHEFFLEIHAGVVSNGEKCVVMPGAPGKGKTTLTAGLSVSGFEYFSDEVALLDTQSLEVRPFPLGLGIKRGAVDTVAALWPDLRSVSAHSREDGQRVRYLSLPSSRIAPPGKSLPVGWLIFPEYGAGFQTSLRPITKGEAMRRLMDQCMTLPQLFDEARVETLVRWMRQVECFELRLSSLAQAVQLITRLCLDTNRRGKGATPLRSEAGSSQ